MNTAKPRWPWEPRGNLKTLLSYASQTLVRLDLTGNEIALPGNIYANGRYIGSILRGFKGLSFVRVDNTSFVQSRFEEFVVIERVDWDHPETSVGTVKARR